MVTVMLIDDEILTCKCIKKILERHEELEVRVIGIFTDGATALKHLEIEKPDFAIVDIRMPNMDGIQLMERIKQQKIDTQVIVLSAYRDFEYAQKALRNGAFAYLTKPLDNEKLLKAIEEVKEEIASKQITRHLQKKLAQIDVEEQQQLLRTLTEKAAEAQQPEGQVKSTDGVIEKAKKYCEQHCAEEIDLQQVADYVCMNRNYFCALFKKATGQNFSKYMTEIRMQKAKRLLAETDYRAHVIAELTGYKNPSHFGRVFKTAVGMTPAEYRLMISTQQ